MKKLLVNLLFIVAICLVSYLLFRNLDFKEGMATDSTTSTSTSNGIAGSAQNYAANIKSITIQNQDMLLISKYRKEYENAILNLDDLINTMMLQTALTVNNDTNVTLTSGGSASTALVNAASITAGWTGLLSLARGGTNASLTGSSGGIAWFNGTSLAISSNISANNRILLSTNAGTPLWSSAVYPATASPNVILYASSSNNIVGLASVASSVLTTNSSSVPTWSGSLTNGQIVIGSTGATPSVATINQGTGIAVTNGPGTISIAVNGATPWVDQTTTPVTMTANTGYVSDSGATLLNFTLPATSAIGDFIEINGKNSGLWKINQNAGQQIFLNTSSTTVGVGGSLSSTVQYANIRLRCITANTSWTAVSTVGSFTTV